MRSTALAISLVALLAAPALGAPKLLKAEKTALKKAERELLKLAKFAYRGRDLSAARAELELGLAVAPESKRLKREVKKVEKRAKKKKQRAPKATFPAKLTKKRVAVHKAVSLFLADAALATEKAHPKRYDRYLKLIQTRFPSQAALDKLDLVYFAPYYAWVSKTEAALLKSGGERHGGKALNASAVQALDQRHATWSNPWVVSDEIHEVRTTVGLRKAKQILAYVAAYRKYFLGRFGSLWQLRKPSGKLPIIVTRTQAELQQQMQKITGGRMGSQGIQGAAFYLQTTGKLNPCFVTYEPKEAGGSTFKINNFKQLQIPLAHEVTHQIAFEYSKHDANSMRQIQHHFWSVEAIANYMGYHSFDGTRWTLTHPRMIPMGRGYIEGPFAHCVNNVRTLPSLTRFMGLSRQQFMSVNNYHIAATLAYFLLEGEGGKYRKQFVKLLQAVHRVKDAADTFEACFPGVDRAKMQQEWLRFVKGIKIDA